MKLKNGACTSCRGHGVRMKFGGTTKGDVETCTKCNGTGKLPEGYVVKKNKNYARTRNTRRDEGMEELKEVEAV